MGAAVALSSLPNKDDQDQNLSIVFQMTLRR